MFDMGLGVSLDGITGVMDYKTIELLEKSSVSTFEWSPWCFWTDYDGEIRTAKTVEFSVAEEKIRFFYPKGLTWQNKVAEKV